MANPLKRLIEPNYPPTALGLEQGVAAMVQLDGGRRNQFNVRRAASVALPESLIRPSFDQPNIADLAELGQTLRDLATSAGLLRQTKWSVTLPEATVRSMIVTMEQQASSRGELEDVLRWKTERGLGASLEELQISRERLPKDSQGRDRYLVAGVRAGILAEYESVFKSVGWRAGVILPRHVGESFWLTKTAAKEDSLLVSSHAAGFTAVILHNRQPVVLRSVLCDEAEREDEFYRLLLFYRDRRTAEAAEGQSASIGKMLVVGSHFDKNQARQIASETLDQEVNPLAPIELGLKIPTADLSFDAIAAPAGLAAMHWA